MEYKSKGKGEFNTLFATGSCIIFLLFSVSCKTNVTPSSPTQPTATPKTVMINEQNLNGSITLKVNDTLQLTLDANPSTGFQWELTGIDPGILAQMGEPQFKTEKDIPGSGGKQTWQFKTLAAGSTQLRLIYHRSFEKDVPPAKEFTVTINAIK